MTKLSRFQELYKKNQLYQDSLKRISRHSLQILVVELNIPWAHVFFFFQFYNKLMSLKNKRRIREYENMESLIIIIKL